MQAPTHKDLILSGSALVGLILGQVWFWSAVVCLTDHGRDSHDMLWWVPLGIVVGIMTLIFLGVVVVGYAIRFIQYFRPQPYARVVAWLGRTPF